MMPSQIGDLPGEKIVGQKETADPVRFADRIDDIGRKATLLRLAIHGQLPSDRRERNALSEISYEICDMLEDLSDELVQAKGGV